MPPGQQVYGYGGALVAKPGFGTLHRDQVAAVYKLSQTGPKAVMKFGNEAKGGKMSIPGRPVVWRRIGASTSIPPGIIAQEGEFNREEMGGYVLATEVMASLYNLDDSIALAHAAPAVVWSSGTRALRDQLVREARVAVA